LGGDDVHRMSMDQTSWDAATGIVNAWTVAGKVGMKPDDTQKTITDAVTAFMLDATARGLTHATLKKYRFLSRGLIPWCKDNGYLYLSSLTLDALTTYRGTWIGGGLSKTKQQERLRAFFGWCVKRDWITKNPAEHLSAFNVDHTPTMPFTAEEMITILAACGRYPARNRTKMTALVQLLRWSGLRIGDAVTITTDRIQNGKVFLHTQKTGTKVWVPLPPAVIEALAKVPVEDGRYFWSGKGKTTSASSSWQRALRVLFTLADIPDGHAHRFRDTFAVELLLQGVELADVSILLGHASIKVTEKHYSPWVKARQSRLETAVQKAWSSSTPPTPPASTPSVPAQSPHPAVDGPRTGEDESAARPTASGTPDPRPTAGSGAFGRSAVPPARDETAA
jgi:integrase